MKLPSCQSSTIVSLTHDLPEHALKQGDKGAIVHCYPNTAAFEVEFVNPEGHTLALVTLTRSDEKVTKGGH